MKVEIIGCWGCHVRFDFCSPISRFVSSKERKISLQFVGYLELEMSDVLRIFDIVDFMN